MNTIALRDLIADGHHRVQARHGVLEDHGDLLAANLAHFLCTQLQQVLAFKEDLTTADNTGRVRDQTHDAQRRSRLACAGFTDEADALTLLNAQVKMVDRLDDTFVCTVFNGKILNLENRFRLFHFVYLNSSYADPMHRAGRRRGRSGRKL